MGSFRQKNSSGGGNRGSFNRDSGKRSFGGNRGSSDREMFKAVCDDCGKTCQVPFKPSGNKPVYCSNCFEKHGNGEDNFNRSDSRDFRSNDDKEMFSATCDECGKRCEVPFRPTSGKPIFCNSCFGKQGNGLPRENKSNNAVNDQLGEINMKLDQILKALNDK